MRLVWSGVFTMVEVWKYAEKGLLNIHRSGGLQADELFRNIPKNTVYKITNLLAEIGYISRSPQGSVLQPTTNDKYVIANRLALLRLAAKFQKIFPLKSSYAEGIEFFGASFSPEDFGIEGHHRSSQGSAGKGIQLQQAFESCVGEAAEFLSFLKQNNDELIATNDASTSYSEDETIWLQGMLSCDVDKKEAFNVCVEMECLTQNMM